jgi:hypothetical protein
VDGKQVAVPFEIQGGERLESILGQEFLQA